MIVTSFDCETYFADDYHMGKDSKSLTTEEYVRDPRFEFLCGGVVEGNAHYWADLRAMRATVVPGWKRRQDAGDPVIMLAHHAHFDGLILNEYFDFRPDGWLDTLSMGRVCFDSGLPLGLDALAERLGFGNKSIEYNLFKNRHWNQLTTAEQEKVGTDCLHDAVLTQFCFGAMMHQTLPRNPAVPYAFPASQLPLVDATIRMFTEPCLKGDLDRLADAWYADRDAKTELFERVSQMVGHRVEPGDLRKDELFAQLLRSFGEEPELKETAKGNTKYAFAKSDYYMQDLTVDEDPDIALLAEARQRANSSIYKSRIERYGEMATRGLMCIYLSFAAAHTRRWGGSDKTNFHNLPRPNPRQPLKGMLRKTIVAP